MKNAAIVLLLVSACLLGTGCVYYRVRDASSGREYITNNWGYGQNAYTGSMSLTDMKTGKRVVLQAYEMERISKEEAEIEIHGSYRD